jgi:uncharacterized protein (TIGR02145 family)
MKYKSVILMFVVVASAILGCKREEEEPYVIERSFVTDVEGNVYQTVKIGSQWWMAENLRVTRFNDGTPIQRIEIGGSGDTLWANTDSAAYCSINDSLFGCLYNAHVIKDMRKVAPEGWHIPSDEEWQELERTIGMSDGETDQTGWRGTNEANLLTSLYNLGWPANDQDVGLYGSDYYGFNAKPANVRAHDGRTNNQNNSAWWWCNTSLNNEFYYRSIDTYHQRIFRQVTYSSYGMSIRCVKN